ncbi:hypothetical protein [Sphingomonas sp.]|uniref:hypothetical protein n=1 Tax=Sphingomonas sp. TaxID=28214 RepID=UPI003B004AB2
MDDALLQVRRDIARAQRIAGGLSDDHSRRILRAYIRELEAKVAQAQVTGLAA